MSQFNPHASARVAHRRMVRRGLALVPHEMRELFHCHSELLVHRPTEHCRQDDHACESRRQVSLMGRCVWVHLECPFWGTWAPRDIVEVMVWAKEALQPDDRKRALRYMVEDRVFARALAALVQMGSGEAAVDCLYVRSQRGEVVVFPRQLRLYTGRSEVDCRPFMHTRYDP